MSDVEFCRICHEEDLRRRMVMPCKCRGSIAHVHYTCLHASMQANYSDKCTVCNGNYAFSLTAWFLLNFICVKNMLRNQSIASTFIDLLCIVCFVSAYLVYVVSFFISPANNSSQSFSVSQLCGYSVATIGFLVIISSLETNRSHSRSIY